MTLLYWRLSPPQRTLAALFDPTQQTVYNVIRQTRPLLAAIGYTPQLTGIRLRTPAELASTRLTQTPSHQTRSITHVLDLQAPTPRH
jgi:hypothetical protein